MNPWGLLVIFLGILLIIIGYKGSQHDVLDVLKNVHLSSSKVSKTKTPTTTSTGNNSGGGGVIAV